MVLVICFRFLLYDFFFSTSNNVIIVVISLTLLVILVPYAISFIYYGKILIYARRLARQEAAERRHFDGSVVLDNNIGPQEGGHSHLFRISFCLDCVFLPFRGLFFDFQHLLIFRSLGHILG